MCSTSGPTFEAPPQRVTLPSRSYHRVVVTGKVSETGTLIIRGCVVEASGGTREFLLPLSTPEEEEKKSLHRAALRCEKERSKYSGLEAIPSDKLARRMSDQFISKLLTKSSMKFLECKVVPEQPLLRIRRSSVTHGALMLYDGER